MPDRPLYPPPNLRIDLHYSHALLTRSPPSSPSSPDSPDSPGSGARILDHQGLYRHQLPPGPAPSCPELALVSRVAMKLALARHSPIYLQ